MLSVRSYPYTGALEPVTLHALKHLSGTRQCLHTVLVRDIAKLPR